MTEPHAIPAEFSQEPWRRIPDAVLSASDAVPTMLHRQEQKLYYWLTRNEIGGPGSIVDLGSFVGGSTARMAQGAADAGSAAAVHAYDRFTVDPRTKQSQLYAKGVAPFEGNEMRPLAEALLRPWADRITLHQGDILQQGWNPGDGPIAVLALDACKTPELTDHIARTFYPHLVAGRSVIMHQDFLQWDQPWLPAHMLRLGRCFQPLAFVRNTTMVFRCVEVPLADDLAGARVLDITDAQMIEAIDETRRHFKGWGIGRDLMRMGEGVRLNPNERLHWKMTPPPRK